MSDLDTDPGNADLSGGELHTLSRELTKRLPLAELLDETREAMSRGGGNALPWVRSDTYAVDNSTHVGRITRAAFIHAEEVAKGSRSPSKATCERLDRPPTARGGTTHRQREHR